MAALGWLADHRLGVAVLLAAAVYELTPLKRACLYRCCKVPSEGMGAALRRGLSTGGWCVGCCAGLMAALLPLGMTSLTWMATVAAMSTASKLLPSSALPRLGSAAVLSGLALALGLGAM